jgi:hypothetical protein
VRGVLADDSVEAIERFGEPGSGYGVEVHGAGCIGGVFPEALWVAGDAHYLVAALNELEAEMGSSESGRAYDPDCL